MTPIKERLKKKLTHTHKKKKKHKNTKAKTKQNKTKKKQPEQTIVLREIAVKLLGNRKNAKKLQGYDLNCLFLKKPLPED